MDNPCCSCKLSAHGLQLQSLRVSPPCLSSLPPCSLPALSLPASPPLAPATAVSAARCSSARRRGGSDRRRRGGARAGPEVQRIFKQTHQPTHRTIKDALPGRRYGLIGRNGKGKSTLLKYLAARRVGSLPEGLSIHYVSQVLADMGTIAIRAMLWDGGYGKTLLLGRWRRTWAASRRPSRRRW